MKSKHFKCLRQLWLHSLSMHSGFMEPCFQNQSRNSQRLLCGGSGVLGTCCPCHWGQSESWNNLPVRSLWLLWLTCRGAQCCFFWICSYCQCISHAVTSSTQGLTGISGVACPEEHWGGWDFVQNLHSLISWWGSLSVYLCFQMKKRIGALLQGGGALLQPRGLGLGGPGNDLSPLCAL